MIDKDSMVVKLGLGWERICMVTREFGMRKGIKLLVNQMRKCNENGTTLYRKR